MVILNFLAISFKWYAIVCKSFSDMAIKIWSPAYSTVFTNSLLWLSQRSVLQPKRHVKPEAAITVFELLIMDGVSLETC